MGLSQREVALLLGCTDGSKVSRHERFARRPTLATAFLYEHLFGVPAQELFGGVYDDARKALKRRARVLAAQLAKQPGAALDRKREFLAALLSSDGPRSEI